MNARQQQLSSLPSVDEVLKSPCASVWLEKYPRRFVLTAIRGAIDLRRCEILEGTAAEASLESMAYDIDTRIRHLSSFSLRPVINATGVVIHTNLGRSILSEVVMDHVRSIATSYSTLEYDLEKGKRGKRYTHIKNLLRTVTGAEDGLAVNNNAAAVLLCLSALASGREVIVSRGELVEIGGSFRVPDVMVQSGAVLREVGTTNKTHPHDYEQAIGEKTALILKVHQSNYRIVGFTEDVAIEKLVSLGRGKGIPVMYDLGSGNLVDLRPYGIRSEPTVQEVVESGPDLVTFSGDKLLGGPQAGIIVGRRDMVERVQGHPLTRAVRIDKLTLAALEGTLLEFVDEERAKRRVPTLRMLLDDQGAIKARAQRVLKLLRREIKNAAVELKEDSSQAGGGSMPEVAFPTYVVAIRPEGISVNDLEERLRLGQQPIIARIKDDALCIDARTVREKEISALVKGLRAALS